MLTLRCYLTLPKILTPFKYNFLKEIYFHAKKYFELFQKKFPFLGFLWILINPSYKQSDKLKFNLIFYEKNYKITTNGSGPISICGSTSTS